MTIVKNKVMQLGLCMLLAGLVFSGSSAFAASNTTQSIDAKDVCADIESADDSEDVADNNSSDTNDAEDICEQAESIKLAKVVAISEKKARQIAVTNHATKGTITELLLARDEDANNVSRIVYEIEFTELDGTQVDVKVDANTGVYLGIDTEDDQDNEDSSDDAKPVTSNSSIQGLQMQLMSLLQQLIALLKA